MKEKVEYAKKKLKEFHGGKVVQYSTNGRYSDALKIVQSWPKWKQERVKKEISPLWEEPKLPDFNLIIETARKEGYAVAIHGSLKRDVDLIAIPWVYNASDYKVLIEELCKNLNAVQIGEVENKPHNRKAVSIQIDGYYKLIDLSIMQKQSNTGIK